MFITGGTSRVGGDQLRLVRLIVGPLGRTSCMTTPTTTKSTPKESTTTKPNGSDHPVQPAVSTSPTEPKPDTRAITVILPEMLARQLRTVCTLGDVSISDTIAALVQTHVKQKLPGLLAGLDASFP